ncbi:MAG: cardiolipin synthase [Bacteroidaceae bacterium]
MKKVLFFIFTVFLVVEVSTANTLVPLAKVDTTTCLRSDSVFVHYLRKEKISLTSDNNLQIFSSARNKFTALFKDIKAAKKHIHLEYFNFRNDSIANLLFEILTLKAEEGVKVRVIFDAFGNSSNNKPLKNSFLKRLRRKGIEIYKFDPIDFPYINHVFHRDHRKIVVIDGLIAYTGGMNVADYYINGLPKIGPWHDMHVRIVGSAVHGLQQMFLEMWEKCTKETVPNNRFFPFPLYSADSLSKTIAVVDRTPRITPARMRRAYVKAIDAARYKIQLVNPYFLPTTTVRHAIKRAIDRGVKVEIMFSSKSDVVFVPDGMSYLANSLMKRGANIYLYQGGFHHSKIMMVDDLFCTVGSSNLNSRSLRFDYEVNVFVFDPAATAHLTTIFERDKQHCILFDRNTWHDKTLLKRFWGWFANLFTPIL